MILKQLQVLWKNNLLYTVVSICTVHVQSRQIRYSYFTQLLCAMKSGLRMLSAGKTEEPRSSQVGSTNSSALLRLSNEMELSRCPQYGGHNLCHLAACALIFTCLASNCQASDFTTMAFIAAALRFQAPAAPVSAFICWEPRKLFRSYWLSSCGHLQWTPRSPYHFHSSSTLN